MEPPQSQESWAEQIHRRGLWQITAGYVAAGWALIEVVDVLVGRSILPEAVFNGVLMLLALGFPMVLATAYVQTARSATSIRLRDVPGIPTVIVPLLTWRNALVCGVMAFALLGVVTASHLLLNAAGIANDADAAIDPGRIAVFPFEVRGSPDLDYLGEGIVDLLSAKLDGAGSLAAVDPRAVIAGVSGGDVNPEDPAETGRFAASLRASRFVTGELLEASGRVRLTAYLHETNAPESARPATVEGEADSVLTMLDSLVAQLLAEVVGEEGGRLQSVATLTSNSLDATKEYLRGEQFLRAGQYRRAADAYDQATALDSRFALAHYRRSIAADWTDAPDIRTSAEHASLYADRLPPRERQILEALRLRRNGRIGDAQQAFRARLHADPDDLEALVQYGELLFHDVGRRGGSIMESIVPFRRAAELEPSNVIAHAHLARLYALADSIERFEETSALIHHIAPETERSAEVAALEASLLGDTALAHNLKMQLRTKPWYVHFLAASAGLLWARNPWLANELLSGRPPSEELLELQAVNAQLVRGRWADARGLLATPALQLDPGWNLFEAFLYTTESLSGDEERLTALAETLASVTGEEMLRHAWVPPYEDITPRFAEYERDFFRANLLIRLNRIAEARSLLTRMTAQDDFTGLGTIKQDAELALEAELRLASGDRTGALAALRSMRLEVPQAMVVRPLSDQPRARFLRAELEMEAGNLEIARAFLLGLDEQASLWATFVRPRIYERLGKIAEEAGNLEEAIAHYTRFIEFLADCDGELVAIREDVEARRNALVRSSG